MQKKPQAPPKSPSVRPTSPSINKAKSPNNSKPSSTTAAYADPMVKIGDLRGSLSQVELMDKELRKEKYIRKLTEEICDLTQKLSEQRLTILQQQIQLKDREELLNSHRDFEKDSEVQDMKQLLKSKEQEMQSLLKQNAEAKNEIKNLRLKVADQEKEIKDFKSKIQKQSTQHQNEMSKLQTIRLEHERMKSQYDGFMNTIRSVEVSGYDQRPGQSPQRQPIKSLYVSNKGNLQKDYNQLNQKLHQTDQNLDNVQKALQRKEAEYNQLSRALQDKIQMLEKQNLNLKRKVDELTGLLESRDSQGAIKEMNKRLKQSYNSLQQTEDQRRQYDESLKSKQYELKQAKDTITMLQKEVQELKKSVSQQDRQERFNDSSRRINTDQDKVQDSPSKPLIQEKLKHSSTKDLEEPNSPKFQKGTMKELQSKLRNALSINQELEAQLKQYSSDDQSKEMQIFKLKEQNKNLYDQNHFKDQQISHMQEELKKYQDKNDDHFNQAEMLSKKLEVVQAQLQKEVDKINDEKRMMLEEFSQRLKSQFAENEALRAQLLLSSQEVQELQTELDIAKQKQGDGNSEDIHKSYAQQIKQLQDERTSSEKMLNSQIQLLNRKISELQDSSSKKTLEIQRTKGSRRTSQLQTDHLSIQLQEKELKIQQLQKNLLETKQAYEELVDKAKQMNEKNRQLKDKMSKAHKLAKKDLEEQKEGQEVIQQQQFVWDLTITNEFQNLSTLVSTGWEFSKGSAVPMKPYVRSIFIFSLDASLLSRVLNTFFKQFITDELKPSDLLAAQSFVKVMEDSCIVTKVLSSFLVPGMTLSKGTNVYDHLDHQLWEEIWIDYALQQSNCLVFVCGEMNYQEEEIIHSLIRFNPQNLIIIFNQSPRQKIVQDYLSLKFGLVKQEDSSSVITNNRITLLPMENGNEINTQLMRSKSEEESLFLDSFKQFLQRNAAKFFVDTSKPAVKIQKLLASNTFNYTLALKSAELNPKRIPLIINSLCPVIAQKVDGDKLIFDLQIREKKITAAQVQVQNLSKHHKIRCSSVAMQLRFQDLMFPALEQQIYYVSQLPLSLTDGTSEINGERCSILAKILND